MSDTPTYILDEPITTSTLLTDEVQTVTLKETEAKTWTLTFDGETTAAIKKAAEATAAEVQTKLLALPQLDSGDVVVTGSTGGPFTVTFGGDYAETDVPALTGTVEEGEVIVATTTAGGAATAAVQRGTGNADRTEDVSPLTGNSPAEDRVENNASYGDAE
jgi:hypothetical protein